MTHDQQPQSTSTFDYVVIGTGAAGSIVAARLSEDPGITVCALESGPPDRHPYIHIPADLFRNSHPNVLRAHASFAIGTPASSN